MNILTNWLDKHYPKKFSVRIRIHAPHLSSDYVIEYSNARLSPNWHRVLEWWYVRIGGDLYVMDWKPLTLSEHGAEKFASTLKTIDDVVAYHESQLVIKGKLEAEQAEFRKNRTTIKVIQ